MATSTMSTPHPLKSVLVERRITQRELADAVGLNCTYLGRVINGLHPVGEELAERISEVLGVPAWRLFHGHEVDMWTGLYVGLDDAERGLAAIVQALDRPEPRGPEHLAALEGALKELRGYQAVLGEQVRALTALAGTVAA